VSPGGHRRRGAPRKKAGKALSKEDIAATNKKLKGMGSSHVNYRERSLSLHGLICAKCAREFSWKDRHLLTVHHKDGNDKNNPPDGSNWENLCVDCHEAEHSRGLLGDYIREDD
jgi:hypothetical protein